MISQMVSSAGVPGLYEACQTCWSRSEPVVKSSILPLTELTASTRAPGMVLCPTGTQDVQAVAPAGIDAVMTWPSMSATNMSIEFGEAETAVITAQGGR